MHLSALGFWSEQSRDTFESLFTIAPAAA